jgi:hypothetical protein
VQTDGLDAFAQLHRDWEASLRREAALQRSNAEKDEENERLAKALFNCASGLAVFINAMGMPRKDGSSRVGLIVDKDAVQTMLAANNEARGALEVRKALSHSSETSNG